MRSTKFVLTSNVRSFLAGLSAVEERGAPEASIMLVEGKPGLGKTRTGEWWAMQQDAIFVRLQPAHTPHWVLKDVVVELGGIVPASTCEKMYAQAAGILAKAPRPIVIDEAEHGLRNGAEVLDTLRGLTDLVETPLILVGREFVWGEIKKHPQLSTRVSQRVVFKPCGIKDVRLCFDEKCEVTVDDGVIEQVTQQSEGQIREIVNAIANIERFAARNKIKSVTRDQVAQEDLVRDLKNLNKTKKVL